MEKEVIISLSSALAAIVAAFIAAYSQRKVAKINQDMKLELQKTQYREPFLKATYDLQGRLYNLIKTGYIDDCILQDTSLRKQKYAIDNTAFLIAQFFAWNELIRNELFYLDVNNKKSNIKLASTIDKLYSVWKLNDFQVYPGEQRAIAELMIENQKCIGYSTFLKRYSNKTEEIINVLYDFIDYISKEQSDIKELIALHSGLIDILDILDPKKIKFPLYRDKIIVN